MDDFLMVFIIIWYPPSNILVKAIAVIGSRAVAFVMSLL
ncbi:hypothetical protein H1P_5890004 [Hyella patelloides LEGE 07179]|uniref:Uncharacterized protein n=1 Tax=Hyella patelloides LEGE 07179 TaxID=945734 RepID=A0A563W0T7_9CYAN|nr:hypothetical protein H1P_5890004 [Hyella patelloides LEGE 07179]